MLRKTASLAAAALLLTGLTSPVMADNAPGVTAPEIKIGAVFPFSGPASALGAVGKSLIAYVSSINDRGGINGRKINLIALDDAYSPPKAVEQTRKLVELLGEKAIGKICAINAEFAFHAGHDWNNFRATNEGGGGGLMDVGTYCVSLARLVAGVEPDRCEFSAYLGEKGYDEWGNGILHFPNDITMAFGSGVHLNMRNDARIYGENGSIWIESPWKCSKGAKLVLQRKGQDPEEFDLGVTNDELYGIEADSVAAFVEAKECPYMSVADTLGQMKTLDALRKSAGLHFKGEMEA